MRREAEFSDCGKYRYWLYREWDANKPKAMCIGLNPSTANAETDDATIESLIRILTHNGYGEFYMVNLFALISTDPVGLRSCPDPLKDNDRHINEIRTWVNDVIFCWGNFPVAAYRGREMKLRFPFSLCLGKNKDGSPRHPLYKKATTELMKF